MPPAIPGRFRSASCDHRPNRGPARRPVRRGGARRCSRSRIPAAIVFLARPVAMATVETPPQPNAMASVAAHCLAFARPSLEPARGISPEPVPSWSRLACDQSAKLTLAWQQEFAQVIFSRFLSKRSHLFRVGDVILGMNIVIFLSAMFFLGVEPALYSILTYFAGSKTLPDFLSTALKNIPRSPSSPSAGRDPTSDHGRVGERGSGVQGPRGHDRRGSRKFSSAS